MATAPPGIDRKTWNQWIDQCPIRRYRQDQDPPMSVMMAATFFGVSMTLIQLWERGVHVPSEQNMRKLVDVLGPDTPKQWADWYNRRPQA